MMSRVCQNVCFSLFPIQMSMCFSSNQIKSTQKTIKIHYERLSWRFDLMIRASQELYEGLFRIVRIRIVVASVFFCAFDQSGQSSTHFSNKSRSIKASKHLFFFLDPNWWLSIRHQSKIKAIQHDINSMCKRYICTVLHFVRLLLPLVLHHSSRSLSPSLRIETSQFENLIDLLSAVRNINVFIFEHGKKACTAHSFFLAVESRYNFHIISTHTIGMRLVFSAPKWP